MGFRQIIFIRYTFFLYIIPDALLYLLLILLLLTHQNHIYPILGFMTGKPLADIAFQLRSTQIIPEQYPVVFSCL